jgi:transposase
MQESTRNQIVHLWNQQTPERRIAKALGISRRTVSRVLDAHKQSRSGQSDENEGKLKRPGFLDPYADRIAALLERYPEMTGVRIHEELARHGFKGSYSTVRDYLQQVRPPAPPLPVRRFETGPGVQGQMDYSTYEIDFTATDAAACTPSAISSATPAVSMSALSNPRILPPPSAGMCALSSIWAEPPRNVSTATCG